MYPSPVLRRDRGWSLTSECAGAMLYVLAAWLVLALVFTSAGGFQWVFPPLIAGPLIAALLALYASSARFRSALGALRFEWLVAFHLTRFVGFYFLALHEQGRLPYDFAVIGGWGDIAVAAAAAGLLLIHARQRVPLGIWQLWNVLGLLDILFVLATGIRSAQADPSAMAPLREFPLGLLPSFVVPLIIFTHLVLLGRLRSRQPRVARDSSP